MNKPQSPQYEQFFDFDALVPDKKEEEPEEPDPDEEHPRGCECYYCEHAMMAYMDLVDAKIKDDEYPHMVR